MLIGTLVGSSRKEGLRETLVLRVLCWIQQKGGVTGTLVLRVLHWIQQKEGVTGNLGSPGSPLDPAEMRGYGKHWFSGFSVGSSRNEGLRETLVLRVLRWIQQKEGVTGNIGSPLDPAERRGYGEPWFSGFSVGSSRKEGLRGTLVLRGRIFI